MLNFVGISSQSIVGKYMIDNVISIYASLNQYEEYSLQLPCARNPFIGFVSCLMKADNYLNTLNIAQPELIKKTIERFVQIMYLHLILH